MAQAAFLSRAECRAFSVRRSSMPWTSIQIPAIRLNTANSSARLTAPMPGRAHRTTPNATVISPRRMNSARVPAASP